MLRKKANQNRKEFLTVINIKKVRNKIRKMFLGKQITYVVSKDGDFPIFKTSVVVSDVSRVTFNHNVGMFTIYFGEEKVVIQTFKREDYFPVEYDFQFEKNKFTLIEINQRCSGIYYIFAIQ